MTIEGNWERRRSAMGVEVYWRRTRECAQIYIKYCKDGTKNEGIRIEGREQRKKLRGRIVGKNN